MLLPEYPFIRIILPGVGTTSTGNFRSRILPENSPSENGPWETYRPEDAPLIKVGRSCFGGTSPGKRVRVPVRFSPPGFANREPADKDLFEKFPGPDVAIK